MNVIRLFPLKRGFDSEEREREQAGDGVERVKVGAPKIKIFPVLPLRVRDTSFPANLPPYSPCQ